MKILLALMAVTAMFFAGSPVALAAQDVQNSGETLAARQKSMVSIAAFTAIGDLPKLAAALDRGLDAGLTVNEIKEILVQMYAYCGFPRSLNGLNTFMAVVDERQKKDIKDEIGKESSPIPADLDRDEYGAKVRAKLSGSDVIPPPSGSQLFVPVIDTFLKEHLFVDIFARDVLDFQTRELITISALAAMTGTAGQLQFHIGAAMNMGLSESQMEDFISIIESEVGKRESDIAKEVLANVLSAKMK
jgi:alkylhydroperoxidase/carboxymuconolactone decarboxylase family protein YurZ